VASFTKQFGLVPCDRAYLYIRFASQEPTDDPEVQFWPIRLKRVNTLSWDRSNKRVRWTASESAIPRGELLARASAWFIDLFEIDINETITIWMGCWVVEK
jgi:hypothetical protein